MTTASGSSVSELGLCDREGLVARWAEVFGRVPPANLSVQLLRAGIAYELQAKQFGSFSGRSREALKRLQSSPTSRPARRPRAGVQLMREWNGVTHIVAIVDDGFLYRDRTFKSLTAIAFEITGARWSGPRFFGLKSRTAR